MTIFDGDGGVTHYDGFYDYWQPTRIRLDGEDSLVGRYDMWDADDEAATREFPYRKRVAELPWEQESSPATRAYFVQLVGPESSVVLRIPYPAGGVAGYNKGDRAAGRPVTRFLPEEITRFGSKPSTGVSRCRVVCNGAELLAQCCIQIGRDEAVPGQEAEAWRKQLPGARKAYGPRNILLRLADDYERVVAVRSVSRADDGKIVIAGVDRSIEFTPLDSDTPTPNRFELYGIIPVAVETSQGLASHALMLYPVGTPLDLRYEAVILGVDVRETFRGATAGCLLDSDRLAAYGSLKANADFTFVWSGDHGYDLTEHRRERELLRFLAVDRRALDGSTAVPKRDILKHLKGLDLTAADEGSWKPADAFGTGFKELQDVVKQRMNGKKPTGAYYIG